MNGYKHFVRLDASNNVTHAFSDAFEHPQDGDILLDSEGGRHFNLELYFNNTVFRWFVSDGKLVERTDAELVDLWNEYLLSHPIEITDSEKILNLQMELTNTQIALTDTYEQLIRSQEETTSVQLALVDVYEQLLVITEGGK